MKADAAAATDVGLVRDHNEDSFVLHTPLYAVADGMGGHLGGEVASSIAIATVRERFEEGGAEAVPNAIREANDAILERGHADVEVAGMGTTLTSAVLTATTLHIAHVGDSRAYLLRDGELTLLTEDHTLVGDMVREGSLTDEQARVHPRRSILVRALGIEPHIEIDHLELPVGDGDRILLCSDGLNSMVADAAIAEILAGEGAPARACGRLVGAARVAGGADNITVIVIDFIAEPGDSAGAGAEVTVPPAGTAESARTAEARGLIGRLFRRKP